MKYIKCIMNYKNKWCSVCSGGTQYNFYHFAHDNENAYVPHTLICDVCVKEALQN